MNRRFRNSTHLLSLAGGATILWAARGLDRAATRSWVATADERSTLHVFVGDHPIITLIIAFVVCVAISRLQDAPLPWGLPQSITWPIFVWLSISGMAVFNGLLSHTRVNPLGLLIELIGYLATGFVLYKGKVRAVSTGSARFGADA